ncbi:MAG TPA: hypothetical protein VM031_05430 [Phycisphaerae bacterium]|nr:hypothetical protein [Phycisphaerae bacterium]
MRATAWCGLAALVVLGVLRPAPAQPAGADQRVKTLADRLLDEAERQHTVNRRMGVSVEGLDTLMRDLLSNELLARGGGPQMKRFVKVLSLLRVRHVPDAERYLTEARKRLEVFRTKVVAADGEIKIIIQKLDELLKKAEKVSSEEDLLTELRLIIRNEENLHQQTREWGKLLYKKPKEAEGGREELKSRQEQIAATVRQFEEKVQQAAKRESEPARKKDLENTSKAMKTEQIDKLLDKAATDINTKKPIPAVQKQSKALEKLKGLEKLLEEGSDSPVSQLEEMRASHKELSEILAEQEDLTQKTQNAPKEKFAQQSRKLQLDQHNLEKDLEKTAQNVPEAADPEVRKPIDQAEKHMAQAAKALEKNQQKEGVKEQKKAEDSLKKALKKLEQQIAEAAEELDDQQELADANEQLDQAIEQTQSLVRRQEQLGQQTQAANSKEMADLAQPQQRLSEEAKGLAEKQEQAEEAGKSLEKASTEMHQATQQMEQGQKTQAQQHQQQALAALRQASQQLQQSRQQAQRVDPRSKTNKPRERGRRDFGRQRPGGRAAKDKKVWDHLNPKERDALRQSFARDLPLEYRELLEDYYEALSK